MVGKSARFLAPIALAAVAVGVYLLVHAALAKHQVVITKSTASTTQQRRSTHHAHRHLPKTYVVKSGDTLSEISAKTGVSIGQLTALNPKLAQSPNSLQTGQRLRLRR
jgi:LysM repeat protein